MSSCRFDAGSFNNCGAWRERIQLEDRTSKLVNLQLAAARDGHQFFDPDKPTNTRFGAKPPTNKSTIHSPILPHLVSEVDRQRIMNEIEGSKPNKRRSGLPDLPTHLDSLELGSRSPSRMSDRSSVSRMSRQSVRTSSTLDGRLAKLEESLQQEREGRLQVQNQLDELKKLMESSLSEKKAKSRHH